MYNEKENKNLIYYNINLNILFKYYLKHFFIIK